MLVNGDGYEIAVIRGNHKAGLSRPGGDNPNASLANTEARQLRQLRAAGWTHDDLALLFGVSKSRSSAICKGRAYKDAGGPVEDAPGRVYNRSVRLGEDRPALVRRVLELRGRGLSQRAIAAACGKSKGFVAGVLEAVSG